MACRPISRERVAQVPWIICESRHWLSVNHFVAALYAVPGSQIKRKKDGDRQRWAQLNPLGSAFGSLWPRHRSSFFTTYSQRLWTKRKWKRSRIPFFWITSLRLRLSAQAPVTDCWAAILFPYWTGLTNVFTTLWPVLIKEKDRLRGEPRQVDHD